MIGPLGGIGSQFDSPRGPGEVHFSGIPDVRAYRSIEQAATPPTPKPLMFDGTAKDNIMVGPPTYRTPPVQRVQ